MRGYARTYFAHVLAFPRYVSGVHSQCEDLNARKALLDNLVDEESGDEHHPELWLRFAEGLGESREAVEDTRDAATEKLIDTFLGAIRSSYAEDWARYTPTSRRFRKSRNQGQFTERVL